MQSKRKYSFWFALKHFLRTFLLLFCWFAPASFLRVFFHRLRGVKIGRSVEIGYFVIIDHLFPEWIEVSDGVVIGLGVKIIAHDDLKDRKLRAAERKPRKVIIGHNVIIGFDAIVLPGVTIGSGTIVGAKSLINKSIPANKVVAGIPARILQYNGKRPH